MDYLFPIILGAFLLFDVWLLYVLGMYLMRRNARKTIEVVRKRKALDWLTQLHARAVAGNVARPYVGICGQPGGSMFDLLEFIVVYAPSWQHYSGELEKPVPGTRGDTASGQLWRGDQLTLRLDLINHIRTELMKELP